MARAQKKTTTDIKVDTLKISMVTNDIDNPLISIEFVESPIDRSSVPYKSLASAAEKIYATLQSYMISKKEEKDKEEIKKMGGKTFPTPIPQELGWEVKYNYKDVKMALPKMEYFKEKLNSSQITLQMYQDKKNEYDENAVMLADGLDSVGYLYKGKIQDMANDWIDRDDKIYVGVSKIDIEKEEVFLTLAFYKSIEETLMLYKKSATLVRTSIKQEFEDRQENISYLEEGDFVDIDIYTTEFENAVVTDSSGGELGELPTALSEKMREDNYDYIGKVIALTENDSGKYGVKIMIFREPTDE